MTKRQEWVGRRRPGGRPPMPLSREDEEEVALLAELEAPAVAKAYRKALVKLQRGQLAAGIAAIAALGEQLDTGRLVTLDRLGELYVAHGPVHPALEPFRRADRGEDGAGMLYLNTLAAAFSRLGRHGEARRLYEQRARLFGDCSDLRLFVAWTYEGEGRLDRAAETLERARQDYPRDGTIDHELAGVCLRLGERERAMAIYRGIAIAPPSEDIDDTDRAHAYIALRRPKEALALLAKPMRTLADASPFYYAALAHIMLGERANAAARLQQMVQYDVFWDEVKMQWAKAMLTREEYNVLATLWPE